MNKTDRAKLRSLIGYLQEMIQEQKWKANRYEMYSAEFDAVFAKGTVAGLKIALRQLAAAFNIPIDLEQEEQS